jgi:hypothetical protein
MGIVFLIVLTIVYISLIFGLIIMIKDIDKRIKNNKISNENKRKIKMAHVGLIVCVLIIACALIYDYLLFLKIV